MATINLGQAAIVSKGAYSAAASYAPLNLVTHNGGSYLCKRGCSNIEPGVSPTWQTYWVAATVGIRSFAKTGETADGMEYTATLSDNSTYVFMVKTAVDYPISVANGGTGATTAADARENLGVVLGNIIENNAGAHNAIYRGKNLGSAVTAAQWAAIQAGTFEDLFIGDYWTINGVNWRIAAFDYYYNTGDVACTTHHVVIVPDLPLYNNVMNDTNTTVGAYVGSRMYTEGLNTAKTTINNAFGTTHILNHRQYLKNAVTGNYESGGAWYDSTVELMTEQNVYGGKIFSNCLQGTNWARLSTIDKSQFPLFAHRPDMISDGSGIFLRDVASSETFCYTQDNGAAEHVYASTAHGVRPAFSIKA
mgnify:CR=1 FL=1